MERDLTTLIVRAILFCVIALCFSFIGKAVYDTGYEHGYVRALLDMQEYMLQKHGEPHGGNTEQK